MYLHEDFLRDRFNKHKRFHFADKVLVNLKELKTTLNVEISGDETLKVVM